MCRILTPRLCRSLGCVQVHGRAGGYRAQDEPMAGSTTYLSLGAKCRHGLRSGHFCRLQTSGCTREWKANKNINAYVVYRELARANKMRCPSEYIQWKGSAERPHHYIWQAGRCTRVERKANFDSNLQVGNREASSSASTGR